MQKQHLFARDVSEQFDLLLDPGSRVDIESQAPQDLLTASGTIRDAMVMCAGQYGGHLGGTLGDAHTRAMRVFIEQASVSRPHGLLLLLDSGGVRLHEGNRGMVGLSRVLESITAARRAGVVCIALIAGKVGCWGGSSLLAGVCDSVLMLDKTRYGLSGPKVLEEMARVRGELFVKESVMHWVTAAHRRATGEVTKVLSDDASSVRHAIHAAIERGGVDPIKAAEHVLIQSAQRVEGVTLTAQEVSAALPGISAPHPSEDFLTKVFDSFTSSQPVAGVVVGTGELAGVSIPFFGCTLEVAMGPAQGLALLRAALEAYRARPEQILLLADAVQAFHPDNEQYGYGRVLGALAQVLMHTTRYCCPITGVVRHAGSGASMVALSMCGVSLYACERAQIHPLPPNVVAAFVGEAPREEIDSSPAPDRFLQLGAVKAIWEGDGAGDARRVLEQGAGVVRKG